MNELDQEIRQKLPECADAHVRKTGFAGKQPTEMRKPVSDFFICHESGFPSDEKIVTEGKWEVNSKRNFCGIICYSSAFGRTVTASGHSKRSTIGRVPRQAGCFQPFCFRTVCAVNAQTWLSSNNNFTFLRLYLSFV
ncbi:MAG TPA: hypothetical protein H9926_01985 [Candidatus Eisenbergiella intestinigallinarum]|uniref:Uncharacterized protein n=1 Tax=Candidatus Eisenbergiella intestinigallinarum TaxID=2838549 RepID=A0A9D2TQF4_9FIRM|nr:hypothetical protein [Candidatus Eisenbergiella intestinigallinarum]